MNNCELPQPRLVLWPYLAVLVVGAMLIPWDTQISKSVSAPIDLRTGVGRTLLFAEEFGNSLSLALAAVLIWLLDVRRRKALWLGAGAIACAAILNTLGKWFIGRPRPRIGDGSFLWPWGTFKVKDSPEPIHAWEFWRDGAASLWSMPSGHTAFAAALAAFLTCMYPRLFWLMLVLTAGVAIGRVVHSSHYPSDVVIGAAVGWFGGTVGMIRVRKRMIQWFGATRGGDTESLTA